MTVPVADSQDPQAVLDYSIDWSKPLAANGGATITAATVTAPSPAVISGTTHDDTSVTWRLACSAVPVGTDVPMTAHVTFSTGEQDERTRTIRVRNR